MAAQTPLRILSLDGGGVRGISSLYMLKELMAQIKRERRVENPNMPLSDIRPCEVFDLICGTSTGGLIAIMLGRLEMVCSNIRHPVGSLPYCRPSMMPLPNIQSSLKPSSPLCQKQDPRNSITMPLNVY